MATNMDVEVYFDARTSAQWAALARAIPKGFPCVEFTDDNKVKMQIGDGVHGFAALPYLGGDIDLTNYYTKTEADAAISAAISGLGSLFSLKGRVDTVSDLPADNNAVGDTYLVGADSAPEYQEYYWTGTMWDYMGTTTSVDLSNYYTKQEVDNAISAAAYDDTALSGRVAAIENDYIKSTDTLILNCTLSG